MATSGTGSKANGWAPGPARRLLAAMLFAAVAAACGLPRDQVGTLDRVRGGVVHVGVAEAPPWVRRAGDEAEGVEADLVRAFAESLGARVAWHWGGVEEHLAALERFELDLVAAGLTAATPWSKTVGLTRPYYTETIAVGVPATAAPLRSVEGVPVAVRAGSVLAAYLEREGAVPVRVDDLAAGTGRAGGVVAAPAWELAALGLRPSEVVLHRARHVMAVPPGENAWLSHLERFLDARRGTVEARLRQEARP